MEMPVQQLRHRVDRQRAAQQIALHRRAAHLGKHVDLLLRLDAFRDDLELEALRHRDDRARDRGALLALDRVRGERVVELQLVERQLAQVGERRVAGPEVVDRDLDAELAQLLQRDLRALEILAPARTR